MPRNVTQNEMNCDCFFDKMVKRPHGRALVNESCHLFQTVTLKVWLRETILNPTDFNCKAKNNWNLLLSSTDDEIKSLIVWNDMRVSKQ